MWRGGALRRHAFQLGWVPPHPTFYVRREVAQKVGDYDLRYITTADYDYMLRAIALNNYRVNYLPRVMVDFQIVGISTRGHDTGDAQIFVDLVDNPRLDHQYTVFAQVLNGIDVVDQILEGDVIDRIEIIP